MKPWSRIFERPTPLLVQEIIHSIPDVAEVGTAGPAVRSASVELRSAQLDEVRAAPGSQAGIWFRFFNSCNLRCQYCNEPSKPTNPINVPRALETLAQLARQGFDRITLSGGEPTLVPELEAFIGELRTRGFRWISLATNGYQLGSGRFAGTLAALNEVYLSLHGLDEVSGKIITGRSDYWAKMESAFTVLRGHAEHLHIGLNHPLTEQTTGLLDRLPQIALQSGARSVQLSMIEQYEDAASCSALIPTLDSFSSQLPKLHQNLHAAGCVLTLEGIPPCHLYGLESCYLDFRRGRSNQLRVIYDNGGSADLLQFSRGSAREVGKVYGSSCNSCAYHNHCRGIYHSYIARHGETELRPVSQALAATRLQESRGS